MRSISNHSIVTPDNKQTQGKQTRLYTHTHKQQTNKENKHGNQSKQSKVRPSYDNELILQDNDLNV